MGPVAQVYNPSLREPTTKESSFRNSLDSDSRTRIRYSTAELPGTDCLDGFQ